MNAKMKQLLVLLVGFSELVFLFIVRVRDAWVSFTLAKKKLILIVGRIINSILISPD